MFLEELERRRPLPAMIAGSSYGGTSTRSRFLDEASGHGGAVIFEPVVEDDLGPVAAGRSTLRAGASAACR